MIEKLQESKSWQLLLIATLILIVPLTVDINRRMSIIRRMQQEEVHLEQDLAEVQAEQEVLETRLEFVKSDNYVEQWARVEARMALPGEVAIVPMTAQSPESVASPAESDRPLNDTPLSVGEQWHRLFFDEAVAP